jgi:hypothetical protein
MSRLNIHGYITTLLSRSDGSQLCDVEVSSFGDSHTVEISNFELDDKEFIEKAFTALGMVSTLSDVEKASSMHLAFTNDPNVVNSDDLGIMEELTEDEDTVGPGVSQKEIEEHASDDLGIDGNRQKLRVLCDPENKKLADKIYGGLLGNTGNYGNYASFLFEFDTFLRSHRPELEEETRRNMEDDENDYDEDERPSNIKTLREEASINEIDIASFVLEFAKEKSARSAVLSALMKLMSGSKGAEVIEAWEKGDPEAMGEAFSNVAVSLMQQMPISEDDSEEDSEEDNSDDSDEDSDSNSDDDSEEDNSDDDSYSNSEENNSGENPDKEDSGDKDSNEDEGKESKDKDEGTTSESEAKDSKNPDKEKSPSTSFVGVEGLD